MSSGVARLTSPTIPSSSEDQKVLFYATSTPQKLTYFEITS